MAYYITYGEIQQQLKQFYTETGQRLQFTEISDILYQKGLLLTRRPRTAPLPKALEMMTDEEFNALIDQWYISMTPHMAPVPVVEESRIIPELRDIFIIRHPRYTRPEKHRHNYFEINFVARGTCRFVFENEVHTLSQGDVCIIGPSSRHDLVIDDESTVFCIMLRKSTFNTTFFSLMARQNVLSYFFRTLFNENARPNYLLFSSKNTDTLKMPLRHGLYECIREDDFSNHCCIRWTDIFFTELLRNYSRTVQFGSDDPDPQISYILQYIQYNYRSLTLSGLAQFFHYSEAYLCTLIRKHTGHSFSWLIRRLKMTEAKNCLIHTDLKISEIAEQTGYHSPDHFSRVFRQEYGMSPQKYRQLHARERDEYFEPFA